MSLVGILKIFITEGGKGKAKGKKVKGFLGGPKGGEENLFRFSREQKLNGGGFWEEGFDKRNWKIVHGS